MPSARAATLVACVVLLAAPARAAAWGFDVHRYIAERAILLLPEAIKPFFEKHRTFLVEHSVDPDLWRTAGFDEEPPRHFLDLDAYGAYPFSALPRDLEEATRKFGREMLRKYGLLPWRADEIYGRLVRAFEAQKQGTSPYALDDVQFFSAVIGHYVGDAHVPLHAVLNYDGQLTSQHGIHTRFETELFQRYRARLVLEPVARPPVTAPRDFVFDRLLESFQLAAPVLEADRAAVAGRDAYDEAYFDRFFEAARPTLERRLAESIAGVAAVVAGAWETAGRPDLPLEPRRPIRQVRPPRP